MTLFQKYNEHAMIFQLKNLMSAKLLRNMAQADRNNAEE